MSVDQLTAVVKEKIELLANSDESSIKRGEMFYAENNVQLKGEIDALKEKLTNLEIIAGFSIGLQFFPPTLGAPVENATGTVSDPSVHPSHEPESSRSSNKEHSTSVTKPTPRPKVEKKDTDLPVNVSRLDMRVGKIVEVEKHPDADSLFVEKVDLGEGNLRTVVSGLVQHVPMEKMQGLVGIFMCNLKPVKMRGIESCGMLMCATDANNKVEPLVIDSPTEVALGDRVYVQGYPGEPDAQLNPKKKVWEQVKPDMRVDGAHLATYKGEPWKLKNSPNAVIKAPTVVDAQIS
ncbi:unnamed protein product [Hydatigera taeniaeformis]|uniref:tRNA-binding domain-containing protein n=1 Tax=Hydatigena taeniaeformis TaxID=6205 RepID=A0A0R3X5B2_HYDTA|nr:unnamed protein product [Hydatigera taeniaeformis]